MQETGTTFTQIHPRSAGNESTISGFLTGNTVVDPVTSVVRSNNDLHRRNADLKAVVCTDAAPVARATLRKGIRRVH